MITARDKLTSLIRQVIEDTAGLELVTSDGKPTPRGGYPTEFLYAQRGTSTALTVHATWYTGTAAFTLTGPAVDQVPQDQRTAHGIFHAPSDRQFKANAYMAYDNGAAIDTLLTVITGLLSAWTEAAA